MMLFVNNGWNAYSTCVKENGSVYDCIESANTFLPVPVPALQMFEVPSFSLVDPA
jgi:hypothetical protein